MFFGIAIAIIVFGFVIRVAFSAFIIAAVMSIIYAIYRRVKDFITYDRYGEYYIQKQEYRPKMQGQTYQEVEPLFYEQAQRQTMKSKAQFVEVY
jgi:hypothetical protein